MEYINLIRDAKEKGLTNESKMWQSILEIGNELDSIKEIHPDIYWRIMRKQHGIMYNRHYEHEFANYDVGKLCYTDRDGLKKHGPHWTKEQVSDATSDLQFPSGVTECDKYVAANATYADLCTEFDDEDVMKIAYLFWFQDEDWEANGSPTKIWDYMCLHNDINSTKMR